MAYRCAHCLTPLTVDENGEPEPCPAHPDGAVDHIPDDTE